MSIRPLLLLAASDGGIGRHVGALVTGWTAAGVKVHVAGPHRSDRQFSFSDRGAAFDAIEIASVPRPVHDARAVRVLVGLLGRTRPDVIHAHGLRAGAIAVLAGRCLGADRPPLVVTWHNAMSGSGPRRRLLTGLEVLVARGAEVNLGASSDLVARARTLGARDARLGPVAGPSSAPSTDPALTRAALALDDRPLLLAVGRLAEQKDYPTLLAAARTWRERTPQPVLVVVGAGPLHERLAAWICAEGLPVRLLGRRDDVADLLALADVAVLSSAWEARSLYAQEALAAGVPLVATAVGGLPELVGDAALLVPPGRPGALAVAVSRVLDEPDLRARLSAAGPVRAASWPTQAEIEAELLALYSELSDRHPPRAVQRGWRPPWPGTVRCSLRSTRSIGSGTTSARSSLLALPRLNRV